MKCSDAMLNRVSTGILGNAVGKPVGLLVGRGVGAFVGQYEGQAVGYGVGAGLGCGVEHSLIELNCTVDPPANSVCRSGVSALITVLPRCE